MREPNDIKRPNTDSGAETRDRKRNYKYLHVSKRILEIPVMNPDGSLTNIKQTVAERHGRTYRNPGKDFSREDERRMNFSVLGWSKRQTDDFTRMGQ